MNNEKMAQFISDLRKSKKITQKELAQQLGVTDKAVSKWERGLGCPDISLLAPLSDILGITIRELLNGERENASAPEVEAMIETTLQYADTVTKNRSKNTRLVYAVVTSAILLLEMFICVICNFAIAGEVTWAWFPVSSTIFIWLVAMPMIAWGKKGIAVSLVLLSLSIIPFLFVIEKIIGMDHRIMPIGTSACVLSLIYLWVSFFVIVRSKLKKYAAASIVVMLGIPVLIGINGIIARYANQPVTDIWDILAYFILAAASVIIFIFGHSKHKN